MTDLVFLEPNKIDAIPFTTSEVIAEFSGLQHHTVTRLIRNHKDDFEEFGKIGFEIHASPESKTGQSTTTYRINEQQATLLMTYLKNTEQVRQFKKELVRQFYRMRSELNKRQMLRTELKPIRRELTDVIREVDNSKWAYKKYTDLAYKSTIGKSAAQLRKERSASKKATAIDYMNSNEIAAVTRRQRQIGVLLEMGMDYEQVKAIVIDHRMVGPVANVAKESA